MQSPRKEVIQLIYLYLITTVGLFMIVIPAVDIVKVGLEKWVFPLAVESDDYDYRLRAPEPYFIKDKIDVDSDEPVETLELTEDEQRLFEDWKENYKYWEETDKNKDYAAINRQEDLVRDISILIGGLVLFLSHGYILRKKKKA
jgi:hypothetical protein